MMPNIPKHTPGKTYEPYEIENAANHLMAAEHVKMNPELHAHAMKHLDKTKKAITSIQQIRDRSKELDSKEGSPQEESMESPEVESAENPFPDAIHGNKELATKVKSNAAHSTQIKKK